MAQDRASVGEQESDLRQMPRLWLWAPLALAIVAVIIGGPRRDKPRPDGSPSWRPWIPLVNFIGHTIGWDRLPWPIGLPVVVTFLRQLRRDNLYDPSTITPTTANPPPTPAGTRHVTARTADGTFNDLSQPAMGSACTR